MDSFDKRNPRITWCCTALWHSFSEIFVEDYQWTAEITCTIIRLTNLTGHIKGGGVYCKSFIISDICRMGRLPYKEDFQFSYYSSTDQCSSLSNQTKRVS